MFTLEDFQAAESRIRPYVRPSLLRYSDWLSKQLQAEVYLKFEALQPGRSFKIRGASNALLSQDQLPEQVITASGGNHGLGVAIACRRVGVPCLVVLPTYTSSYRIDLLREMGAEVKLFGDAWDDANTHALQLAEAEGTLYIHPFADPEVMLGQGTIALELEQELDHFDAVIASVGGGGLLGGIALALEAMKKEVDLYSVETSGAESLFRSLEADELVELPAITSIAKTLGARKTTPLIFETMKRLLRKSYVVSDRDAVQALFDFLDHEKLLVEPAMSCIIAAMLQHPEEFRGKQVVVIVCGSNVSLAETEQWRREFLD